MEETAAGVRETMGLGEKLTEAITPKTVFTIDFPGLSLPVSDAIVVMWIVMAAIIAIAFFLSRKLRTVPGKGQNLLEAALEALDSWGGENMGHHFGAFKAWIGTLFIFLILSNIMAIFNVAPLPFAISPPTKNVNVTGALAVMTIVLVIISGIRYKGIRGYLRGFTKPSPILLPFHILDYVTRPLSLTLRLFGNILGGYLVMELLYSAMPLVVPGFFSIYFDLFDGAIQAFIFSFLSLIYIREITE